MPEPLAPTPAWRRDLPVLTGRVVTLREPVAHDTGPLVDLLSVSDASRFGIEESITEGPVRALIERMAHDRAAGAGFAFVVTLGTSRQVVGLVRVRRLDLLFEAAEWDMTLAPSSRGSGVFLEAARLTGSFAFGTVGVHRLESRVPVLNGRSNGALRKLGAVQEGILRRSLRRDGAYLDQVLWSILKEDWGDQRISTRVH
jgi:RimJ/RimL family protein N-acetyltransferase